jgi:N-acetyl-gamma-glutamyl-phosphate reductase
MVKITGLNNAPIFCPIVSDFYSGMEVTVPIFASQLVKGGIEDIKALYRECYNSPLLYYKEDGDEGGLMSAAAMSGLDSMQIEVKGNDERILLIARYDNLGKGASGAAVECLNIKLGCEKTKTLEVK